MNPRLLRELFLRHTRPLAMSSHDLAKTSLKLVCHQLGNYCDATEGLQNIFYTREQMS